MHVNFISNLRPFSIVLRTEGERKPMRCGAYPMPTYYIHASERYLHAPNRSPAQSCCTSWQAYLGFIKLPRYLMHG